MSAPKSSVNGPAAASWPRSFRPARYCRCTGRTSATLALSWMYSITAANFIARLRGELEATPGSLLSRVNRQCQSLRAGSVRDRPLIRGWHFRLVLRSDAFVLILEVDDGLVGVHVEDRAADGVPLARVEEEHRRGVAQVADGGQAFHVAAFDGLELDGDAYQGGDLAGLLVADVLDGVVPLAVLPAQAARLAAGGGR